eukprot:1347392-Amorphochlora_amoeboformis.AAC.1
MSPICEDILPGSDLKLFKSLPPFLFLSPCSPILNHNPSGNCCACLFAVSKYEKVPVDGVTEGKSTNLELVTTNDPSTTRKERGTSTTIRDLPDSKRTRRPKKQLKPAPRLAMPLEDVALQ